MKLRFIRQDPQEFIDTLNSVETFSQLHNVIRKERSLSLDYDIGAALSLRPYTDYVDPRINFGTNYAIYVDRALIGFADQDSSKLIIDIQVHGVDTVSLFYVDTKKVEHTCCWSARIMKRAPCGDASKDVMYAECSKAHARFVCEALNASYKKVS